MPSFTREEAASKAAKAVGDGAEVRSWYEPIASKNEPPKGNGGGNGRMRKATEAPYSPPTLMSSKISRRGLDVEKGEDEDGAAASKGVGGVLDSIWIRAVSIAWAIFIPFSIGLGVDHYKNGPNALCPHTDHDWPTWYWYINLGVLGAFIMTWLTLCVRIYTSWSDGNVSPLLAAINIVTMGTISTILAIAGVGGICIDVLGVASPAAIWPEWIACGPLLILITVTIVAKSRLNKMDIFMIVTFDACLWAGFFIIPKQPYASGMFWFLISCITYLPMLYLPCMPTFEDGEAAEDSLATSDVSIVSASYAQRKNLSVCLTIILPLYTG